ncbi:MAG: phosphoribosylanthranilate isomerase [Deltaproteobacteria bacterium]
MAEIKICGITNKEDALGVVNCDANALGFVFHPHSPRYVTPDIVREIIAILPKQVVTVGVFVNMNADKVMEIVNFCGLDMIQLHGDETPAYCRFFPNDDMLIKAITAQAVSENILDYSVQAFVVDTANANNFGGTGIICDWNLAYKVARLAPTILAGGINEKNIASALATVNPSAVDVCSGTEISYGKKDMTKVVKVIAIAKKHNVTGEFANKNIFKKREILTNG